MNNLSFKLLLDAVNDGVFFLDTDQRILYCNRSMMEMFGLTQKDFIGKHCWEIVHGTKKPVPNCPIKRSIKSLRREEMEISKSGKTFLVSADPLLNDKRELVAMVHIMRDITENKSIIEKLEFSEQKYRYLVEQSLFGIGISKGNEVIYANPALLRIFGYDSLEEFSQIPLLDHVAPSSRSLISKRLQKRKEEKELPAEFEYDILCKSGEIKTLRAHSKNISWQNEIYTETFFEDITERKKSEKEIRQMEKKYHEILKFSPVGIYEFDYESNHFTYVNDVICELTGYSREELLQMNPFDLFTENSQNTFIERLKKLMSGGKDLPPPEYCLKTKNGEEIWVRLVPQYFYKEEKLKRATGIALNITDKKLIDKVLHERDFQFRKLSANVPGMIYQFMITPDGTYRVPFSTDAINDILGCSAEEAANDFSHIRKVIYPDDFKNFIDSIEQSARNMTQWQCEFRVQIPGKPIKWLFGNSTPEKMPDGSIVWHGFCMDITEHKLMEAELHERDEIFRKLSAHIPGVIYQFVRKPDGSYHLPFSSNGIKNMFGYSPQELANDFSLITKSILPEDLDDFISSIEYSAQHMTEWKHEYRIQLPGEPVRWMMGQSTPEQMPDGSIVWYGFNADITEQKKAQEDLKISQENYKRLFEDHSAVKLIIDPETGSILDANYSAASFYGWSRDEIKKMKIWQINNLSEDEVKREMKKALQKKKVHFEFYHRLADGTLRNVEVYSSKIKINGKDVLHSIIHDITDRKQLEESLKKSEIKFKLLFENSPVGVFMLKDRKFTDVNPAFCKIMGYSKEELIGQSVRIGYADDEEFQRAGLILYEQAAKKGIGSVEARCIRKNGEIFYALLFISQIDPQDISLGYECIMADIDERKRADEKLRFEQQRFKSLTESSSDIIIVLNPQGLVTYINPAIEKILGYTPEERIGKNGFEFIHPDNLQSMIDKFNILINSTKYLVLHDEIRIRHKNGTWRIFETTSNNIIKDNVVEAIIIRQHNITERKLMEEKLRENEEKFRRITENMSGFVSELDPQGIFRYNSPSVSAILGYTPEELINRNAFDFVHPEDRNRVMEKYMEGIRTDSEKEVEQRYLCKNGNYIWLRSSGRPIYEPDGKNIGMVVNSIDITDRKFALEALRKSEEKYKGIFDESVAAIYIFDENKNFIDANQSGLDLLGYSKEELLKMHISDICCNVDELLPAYQKLLEGERLVNYEHQLHRKDGSIVTVLNNSRPLTDNTGNSIGILSTLIDITERKIAEKELQNAKDYAENLLKTANVMIVILDAQGNVNLLNEAGEKITGYTADEVIGKSWFELICPREKYTQVWNKFENLKKSGKIEDTFENPIMTKSGEERIISWKNSTIYKNNQFVGTLSFGIDITGRKRAEEAVRESETKLKDAIQGSPIPQFVIDKNHKILYWNKALEELSGIKSADVVGTNRHWQAFYSYERPCLADLLIDEKTNVISELYKGKFHESNYARGAYDAEDFFPSLGDVGKWLFFSAAPIRDTHGNIIAAIEILEDITDRKKAEEELNKYRKHLEELVHERTTNLEAANKELEAFSYSASHDLRAPLRSIEGFSQALLEDYHDKLDTQGKDYLARIKTATRRMADLIEDMLLLSRITRMEMNIEKVNLTEMAKNTISELKKLQPQRNVQVTIAQGLEDKADPRLTRIVIENLLNNAWKFTGKQAKAIIEFGLWKKECEKNIYFVRDNGAGFDMAYADKLFAPFQRLHADDEFPGTGIGLATIRRIINRHGGKIWAEGETGKGATFYFSFS